MNEKDYYENPYFWTAERYLSNIIESERFKSVASIIPENVISMLDVGCGNGSFLRYIEREESGIKKIAGIERSSVAIANKVCQADIFQGSSDHIDLPDFAFDIVVALELIEHLPKGIFEKTLKELERIACNYIIISVPFCEKGRLIECDYCGCKFSPFYHLREFNKTKMESLLKDFTPLNFKFIHEYKNYFFWDFLKGIWYRLENKIDRLPPYSECPQCGNRGIEVDNTSLNTNEVMPDVSIKQFFKRITPYKNKYIWIACLYRRKETLKYRQN